jgi:hypothetical protein
MADDKPEQQPEKKVIKATLHGHEWPVYVCQRQGHRRHEER